MNNFRFLIKNRHNFFKLSKKNKLRYIFLHSVNILLNILYNYGN